MPFNAISNLITGVINTAVDGAQNAKNLKWEKEAFQRQQDFEKAMAEDAQAFEKAESELAFQREKEMWNMQNEYNTPIEQMKRYQDAGLSPYLIYGQGTPGNADSAPSYSPTKATKPNTLTPPNLPTFKSSLPTNLNVLQGRQILSQLDINKEQENFLSAQTANTDEKTVSQAIDNTYKVANWELDLDLKRVKFKLDSGIITKNQADEEYTRAQTAFYKRTAKIREKYLSNQVELQGVENRQKEQEIRAREEDINLKQATLLKIQEETKNIKNANEKASIEIQILEEKLGTARIVEEVKRLTGREYIGSDPISSIHAMLARGEIGIRQILGIF